MNDERRLQLIEEYEDAAIKLLMDEYSAADGERLWQEYMDAEEKGIVPEIPNELDIKCRRLIQKSYAKGSRKRTTSRIVQTAARMAAAVCIVIGLSSVMILSVEAFRIPVLNFFMDISKNYSTISFDDEDTSTLIHEEIIEKISGAPIPKGYQIVAQNIYEDGTIFYSYQDSHSQILTLEVRPVLGKLYYDTEDADQTNLKVGKHEAIFIEKNGYRIIWIDEELQLTYDLFADGLDLNDFWKLAFSLAE